MTHFYSGQGKVPAAGAIEYKFTYTKSGAVNWESVSNRMVTVNQDTTLYWVWFNNTPYAAPVVSDTVVVTFTANLARAISERGFAIGDTIVVRSGYNATAKEVREKRMNRVGISTNYAVVDTVVTAIGRTLNYQYYVVKNGLDYREIYFDFNFPDPTNPAAERRRADVTGSTLAVVDTSVSNTSSRRVPRFRNQQKLSQPVSVTYTVDLRPAVYALYAGKKLVATNRVPYVISDPDSIKHYGVWMNGPAVGGWDVLSPWGDKLDTVKMYDDGMNGDAVANDLIYSSGTTRRRTRSARNSSSASARTTTKAASATTTSRTSMTRRRPSRWPRSSVASTRSSTTRGISTTSVRRRTRPR
jgi:hypothetical protein